MVQTLILAPLLEQPALLRAMIRHVRRSRGCIVVPVRGDAFGAVFGKADAGHGRTQGPGILVIARLDVGKGEFAVFGLGGGGNATVAERMPVVFIAPQEGVVSSGEALIRSEVFMGDTGVARRVCIGVWKSRVAD